MLLASDAKPPDPVTIYEPQDPTVKTVTILLHGRCNVPEDTCARFAPVITKHSWLVCPSGPIKCSDGKRSWAWNTQEIVSKVSRGSEPPVIIGYSLGAYKAMELTQTYPKMLLIGAKVYPQPSRLQGVRLVMAAGELDGTAKHMAQQSKLLTRQGFDVRFFSLGNTGHYLTKDFPDRLEPALSYLYGP